LMAVSFPTYLRDPLWRLLKLIESESIIPNQPISPVLNSSRM
jgi:hypothetical protein